MNVENDKLKVQRALLDEALTKGIQRNEEQCRIWTAYKKGHQTVVEALQTFQKDLYVNCMIPIGKRALMKGKLIHTNEVLACLGDGYFAKYSVAGATALCERRIENAEEMLKNLSMERDLFETRLMASENELFDSCAGTEIVEHWNDDQIADWRKKHREREREYHQKLAKVRQEEKKRIETEEDLFDRLDQLEIEEELADELNRLEDEKYELFGEELEAGECYYESESSTESEEEDTGDKEEPQQSSSPPVPQKEEAKEPVEVRKIKKSVSFIEPTETSDENLTNDQKESGKDEVDSEDNIFRIEFTHSPNNPPTRSDNKESIETPADIYRLFSKPKSILKRSPNDVYPEQPAPPEYSTEEDEEEEEEVVKQSAYETVVKDIKERSTEVVEKTVNKEEEPKDTRPVSKFKRDRQLRR